MIAMKTVWAEIAVRMAAWFSEKLLFRMEIAKCERLMKEVVFREQMACSVLLADLNYHQL